MREIRLICSDATIFTWSFRGDLARGEHVNWTPASEDEELLIDARGETNWTVRSARHGNPGVLIKCKCGVEHWISRGRFTAALRAFEEATRGDTPIVLSLDIRRLAS